MAKTKMPTPADISVTLHRVSPAATFYCIAYPGAHPSLKGCVMADTGAIGIMPAQAQSRKVNEILCAAIAKHHREH